LHNEVNSLMASLPEYCANDFRCAVMPESCPRRMTLRPRLMKMLSTEEQLDRGRALAHAAY
jgi:hypothetical protein